MRSTLLLCAALLVACDTRSRDAVLTDTAAGSVALDTGVTHYGAFGDSARGDTGAVTIFPSRPRVGGVIVATLAGDTTMAARCTWKGAVIPCHSTTSGVRVFIPLSAGDSAGSYELGIEAPNVRIARQVSVSDHNFGRELILLDDSLHALVQRRSDIARDARSIRQVLSRVSDRQRWTDRWRDPAGERELTTRYGVEHFYARASAYSRRIPLGDSIRALGAFGVDTLPANAALPSWRHSGVDVAIGHGGAVDAPAAGVVADVAQYVLMGRTLLIDHGLGVFSAFFHLDTVLVRRGDVVDAGRPVARVGSTGLATGPHLHYAVYVNGRDVDPALWREAVMWMDARSVAQIGDSANATKAANRE